MILWQDCYIHLYQHDAGDDDDEYQRVDDDDLRENDNDAVVVDGLYCDDESVDMDLLAVLMDYGPAVILMDTCTVDPVVVRLTLVDKLPLMK